ncbi:MAG: tetratricopeptide repeat protein [Rikenellaceae bacterium]
MIKAELQPTIDNNFQIVYDENTPTTFEKILYDSQKLEMCDNVKGACDLRYEGFQQLMKLLPEDEAISLDWEDKNSYNAMMLLSFTAIDHFLIGDFEMSAAMCELLLDLDPEDHTDATKRLAYSYVALEEWELFDEVIDDISDKYPEKSILKLWSGFLQGGKIEQGELRHFKKSFEPYFTEFTLDAHPADEEFIAEIESDRPSKSAYARELWLQTEHIWKQNESFIAALKN